MTPCEHRKCGRPATHTSGLCSLCYGWVRGVQEGVPDAPRHCPHHGDSAAGMKFDSEKGRWDLLPWRATNAVVDVLTYGAKKYAPDNWRKVEEPRRRYFSAALRHLYAWYMGERNDPESGKPHLAHAICCLMFLLEPEQEVKHETSRD